MSPSPVNDDPRTRVGMGAARRNDRAHRSGRSLIVPVRDAEPEGRWQELVRTCLGHVTPEGKNFMVIRITLPPQCPSSFRQIAGLRCIFCQPLPAPFYLPSSNNT